MNPNVFRWADESYLPQTTHTRLGWNPSHSKAKSACSIVRLKNDFLFCDVAKPQPRERAWV